MTPMCQLLSIFCPGWGFFFRRGTEGGTLGLEGRVKADFERRVLQTVIINLSGMQLPLSADKLLHGSESCAALQRASFSDRERERERRLTQLQTASFGLFLFISVPLATSMLVFWNRILFCSRQRDHITSVKGDYLSVRCMFTPMRWQEKQTPSKLLATPSFSDI